MGRIIKTMLFVCLVIGFTSCKNKKSVNNVNTTNNALIIGDPMDCGLDSLTIFPVGCSYIPKIIEGQDETQNEHMSYNLTTTNSSSSKITFEANVSDNDKFDRSAAVEFVNTNQEDFDIRNLIFYNLITNESYPLVHDSIHILSFALHKEFQLPLIFYRVVKEDYNKDKKFDSFDPVMLYISNLDGSNFTQITPKSEYFIDYKMYQQTNSILIKTAIDSNKDKKFLVDDETNFRSMNLNKPKFAENIFDNSIKDTLRKYN